MTSQPQIAQVRTPQQRQKLQREWFQQLIGNGEVNVVNDPGWLLPLREEARQSISTLPLLNRKLEAWRYNRVDNIFQNSFDPRFDNDLEKKISIEDIGLPAIQSYRLVFVNGRFELSLSEINELPEGVTLSGTGEALRTMPDQLRHWFDHIHQPDEQLFTALNNALFNDGVYLHINQSVTLDRPVEIIYLNNNHTRSDQHVGSMIQTRNVIDLELGASVTVIEHFISSNQLEKYFHNNVTEINLADDAELKHYRIQDESRQAHHLSRVHVTQQKCSRYFSTCLAFGGIWSKSEYRVEFQAQQAECDLHGLYTVGDQQLTDFHLDVQHRVPSCRSSEQFKGILYGKGRAVFDGRILVDRQAQHSDAALTNDNLLLVRDAEVDTKPQLEIYADDVKCSHGTTVGRLDPQQLFYMRSRGIAEHSARKMLCQGFAADIIDSFEQQQLRDYVSEKISRTLNSGESEMEHKYGY